MDEMGIYDQKPTPRQKEHFGVEEEHFGVEKEHFGVEEEHFGVEKKFSGSLKTLAAQGFPGFSFSLIFS
jgi:hypothetical protein